MFGGYLGKFGDMEEEIRERAVQVRKVIGSLNRMTKERRVSMEVKKELRVITVLLTLTYGNQNMDMSHRGQESMLWK